MITRVFIGNDEVDLFKDENIELVSSVLDISDVTKNTTDYSKSFTVPASKTNNKIFKHYYEADINNSFDARVKVAGRIELDGLPFKVGKFRLQKVAIKKNKPSSYTINFFGNLVDIGKTLNKDKLSGLDLSTYDHTYDSNTIKTGLTTSLSTGAIVYTPLVKKNYFYNDALATNSQTDTQSNVAYGGNAFNGMLWNDLRPSIKLIKIIEAIETDYSLTFSRDFFGTTEFDNLYMWCNPDGESNLSAYNQSIDWNDGTNNWMSHATDIGTYVTTYPTGGTRVKYQFLLTITPDAGFENVPFTVNIINNGESIYYNEDSPTFTISKFITPNEGDVNITNLVTFNVETEDAFEFSATLLQLEITGLGSPTPTGTETDTATGNVMTGTVDIANEMPDMEIITFLKGLFSMFKLIVIPNIDGTFYIDTLDSYYSKGVLHDITKYVDFEKYDVERGTLLNELSFKFEEPATIGNIQFEKGAGNFYGDEEIKITDDGTDTGELLDGNALSVEVPFEQVLYDRLIDVSSSDRTNFQYGAIVDEATEPVSIKAHIHYVINQPVGVWLIGFQNDLGVKESVGTYINLPSHTYPFEEQNYATIFRSEFSTWNQAKITNNLYTNHWGDYVLSIFNVKKREFKYTAILPLRITYDLDLNDVLKIKQNYYRIDKYSHNLLSGVTTFNLVNMFDRFLNHFSVDRQEIITDYTAKTETSIVTDLQNSTYAKVDTGDGVGFVTVTDSGNILSMAVTSKSTVDNRALVVRVTQTATGLTKDITFTQTDETYTASLDFTDSRNSQYASLLTTRL